MGLKEVVEHLTRPIRRRVMLMVGRAVLALVDDDPKLQVIQIRGLARETLDRVERFQEYGFTSVPLEGAEAVIVCPGGVRQHPLAIAVDDRRYRPTRLKPGEVCNYTYEDEDGRPHRVVLERGRKIRLSAGRSYILLEDSGVTIGAPSFTGVDTS